MPRTLIAAVAVLCGCASVVPSPDAMPVDTDGAIVMGLRIGTQMSVSESSGEPTTLVFVFAGESNAGGLASNVEPSAAELAPRPLLKILNNTSLVFESLDVGTNNLIGHDGLGENTRHGMEIGLANTIEAGTFAYAQKYLIKTGQGASTIAMWAEGQPYWTTLLARIAAAKALLPAAVRWVVWYSQGINDINAGTSVATWKAATIEHLAKIKALLPGCQIVMTQFQGMVITSPAYDTAIQEIADADADVAYIAATGAARQDDNHWSYAGFKDTIVPRMVTATLTQLR